MIFGDVYGLRQMKEDGGNVDTAWLASIEVVSEHFLRCQLLMIFFVEIS